MPARCRRWRHRRRSGRSRRTSPDAARACRGGRRRAGGSESLSDCAERPGRRPGAMAPLRSTGPEPRCWPSGTWRLGEVDRGRCSGPARADDRVEVGDRRHGVARRSRAGSSVNGPQLLGDRLRGVDQRVDVVERGAQVEGGRVELAHEVGQLGRPRWRALWFWRPIAPSVLSSVVDQARRCRASARRARRGQRGAVDDQALERGLVAGELAEHAPRGREEGVQVVEALGWSACRRRRRSARSRGSRA